MIRKVKKFERGGKADGSEHTPDYEPIDYTKEDPNFVITKQGQKLEYGAPVNKEGKFKWPDTQAFLDDKLDYEDYSAQKRAYGKWRKDFERRNPDAKFDKEGKPIPKVGLAPYFNGKDNKRFSEQVREYDKTVNKKSGGAIKTASKRADGIAQRGKTRGRVM